MKCQTYGICNSCALANNLLQLAHLPTVHTLFFFYKNLVYKNIKASKCPKIKNVVVVLLVAISISFEGFEKKMTFFQKTRSLDLSRVRRHFQKKSNRQTDRQFFFSKRHLKWPFTLQILFSTIQRHKKRFKKPLKQFCDGRTDGPTDGPIEKWLIESRSTRLKSVVQILNLIPSLAMQQQQF